jgi:hypothetical protein
LIVFLAHIIIILCSLLENVKQKEGEKGRQSGDKEDIKKGRTTRKRIKKEN